MSRVALDLGFIQIYWYSIMIALGLFVGVSIILIEAKRQKISDDYMINMIFWGTLIELTISGMDNVSQKNAGTAGVQIHICSKAYSIYTLMWLNGRAVDL